MDTQINEPGTGINYVPQINSDLKSCHGPEDGAKDQSLVGDGTILEDTNGGGPTRVEGQWLRPGYGR